jgi:hypothetical protein
MHDLGDGFEEALEGDGFEEVVYDFELEAIEGVVAEGGSKDDFGRRLEGFEELDAGEPGHLYIEEDELDGILLEEGEGGDGVTERAGQLQLVDARYIRFYDLYGEGFIIDDYAVHGCSG